MTADEAHCRYNQARQNYEDAIYRKNQCLLDANEYEYERRQIQQRLNELQNQLNRFLQAQENINKTEVKEQLETGLGKIGTDMGDASDFFKTIASSSEGEINLAAHIMNDDEKKKSHTAVERIFGKLHKAQNNVQSKIDELRSSISTAENKLNELDKQIRDAYNNADYWESVKKKNMNDMEIYKALEKKLLAGC